MMNASMKIVRRAVVSRYRNRIEKLYGEEEDPLNRDQPRGPPLPPGTRRAMKTGEILSERYEIIRELGGAGQGSPALPGMPIRENRSW